MGGLSLRLHGSTRGTQDVDIAIGCNMNGLLEAIHPLERQVLALFDDTAEENNEFTL